MSYRNLKVGWRTVRFGDIAENVAVRVDPTEAQTDVYVGLEHLDPESLHLRQWGNPSDVTGQKLAFKKGDVIFGRRRAYQRKLAVAEFDGICSAHAMVVRAKPEMILPESLPFFLQSDMFMERAIEISVGSLSPTINWKTLRVEEFPLPPIEEQKRIAEILWTADEAHSEYELLLTTARRSFAVIRDHILTASSDSIQIKDGIRVEPSAWHQVRTRDVVKFQGGAQPPRDTFEYSPNERNVRMIQIRDYRTDEFRTYIPKERARKYCSKDDVMIGRYGPPVFQILRGLEGAYNVALIKATPDEKVLSKDYLYYFLKQEALFRKIDHLSQRSSGQTGIDMDFLNSYPFPLPPLIEQKRLVALFDLFEEQVRDLRQHCTNYSLLKKRIFNELPQQAMRVLDV